MRFRNHPRDKQSLNVREARVTQDVLTPNHRVQHHSQRIEDAERNVPRRRGDGADRIQEHRRWFLQIVNRAKIVQQGLDVGCIS